MLIRISGGVEGIREYLETGKMQGRSATRHDLDERVILIGNLGITDAIIHDMKGKGDRYLHITLSFKENEVSKEDLLEVTQQFEAFAFAAYRSDEYSFYAEAHLTRIKTCIDKSTGQIIERKPHIHIVIPKKNLLTQGHLNPFGYVPMTVKYIDAFQEDINQRFGFASPKENMRMEFIKRSEIISRYKGDIFKGANREIRQWVLDEIFRHDIHSLNELRTLLSSRGTVRIRNKGSDCEYLNLKIEGEEKGVNFKDYVFSESFLRLPIVEKYKKMEIRDLEYLERKECHQSTPEISSIIHEWIEIRSKEIKYLNSGRKKEYLSFRNLGRDDQKLFILQKETEYYEPAEKKPIDKISKRSEGPKDHEGLGNECVLNQCKKDRENEKATLRDMRSQLLQEAKKNIDVYLLLDYLGSTRGLRKELYLITKGKDGLSRIKCGSRNFNVADFLTKEIHLSWNEASDILCSVYARQIRESPKEEYQFQKERWNAYEIHIASIDYERASQIVDIKKMHEELISVTRIEYRKRKAELLINKVIEKNIKKAKISILQIEYLEKQKLIKVEMSKKYRAYYSDLKKSKLSLFNYPIEEVHENDELEYRAILGIKGWDNRNQQVHPSCISLNNKILKNGDVEYYKEGKKVLRDCGQSVWVLEQDYETVEIALRLALLKFGSKLRIIGNEQFKKVVVEVSAQNKLQIQFDDPAMNNELEHRRKSISDHLKNIYPQSEKYTHRGMN